MKTRLLINITHGFQARMLLRTAIADELIQRGSELIVVSPNVDEAYFRHEFDRPGFVLEPMPARPSLLERLIVNMGPYFLMNPSLGATLDFKREQYRREHPLRYWLTRVGNRALGRFQWLRRGYLRAERRLFDGSEFDEMLRRQMPDLVITGTPGFNIADAHLLRAARRAKIPTATVVLSWDNLTSKGYMSAHPDHLLVWNGLMRDEALRYHDFRGSITEVGAAQFDVYPVVAVELDKAEFRRCHGIPPSHALVVWGTINEGIYPAQIKPIQELIDRLGDVAVPVYLWIRTHPQSVEGPHAHLADEYRALERENVHVELPPVSSKALPWDLPSSDLRHLADLLNAADVVITPQSTLSIDAACVGTPVINVGIDVAFRRCFEYTHYQNVVKHDGVWIVETMDEMIDAVNAYIADPALHRGGREAIVAEQMGAWFGQAATRTAEMLTELAAAAQESARVQLRSSST